MKPHCATQRDAVRLNASFKSDLTKRDYQCVVSNCYPHQATVQNKTKRVVHCLDCGEDFVSDKLSGTVKCPHCGRKLKIVDGKRKIFKGKFWYSRFERCETYQVIRNYLAICKTGEQPQIIEIQRAFYHMWMGTTKPAICSKRRALNCFYNDIYALDSPIELRNTKFQGSYCFRIKSLTDWAKMYGMSVDNQWSANYLFHRIITDNQFESYFKLGFKGACQILYDMEDWSYSNNHNKEQVKVALKIGVRHNYKALRSYTDCKLWADMVDFIIACGGNVHDPNIVCPDNLHKAHDMWETKMAAMGIVDKGDMNKWNRHQNNKNEHPDKVKAYNKKMESFKNLQFKQGKLIISVITSVDGMIEEGMRMHHCVGDYWLHHPNSLIFSIKKNGLRQATAEVRLSDYNVPQVYADHDKASPYREQITKLLKNNPLIIKTNRQYEKSLCS